MKYKTHKITNKKPKKKEKNNKINPNLYKMVLLPLKIMEIPNL